MRSQRARSTALAWPRARNRHAARAEAALAMSLGLGLRAKELAGLRRAHAYDAEGRVRPVLHLRAAYTKGGRAGDAFLSSPALRRVLARYPPEAAFVVVYTARLWLAPPTCVQERQHDGWIQIG